MTYNKKESCMQRSRKKLGRKTDNARGKEGGNGKEKWEREME
jgi:hypothetical protein